MMSKKYTLSYAEFRRPKLSEDERKKQIELIRKGFFAAGVPRDNPEILLNNILIEAGLIDPIVAEMSDELTVEQITDLLVEKIPPHLVKSWEVKIRMTRDLEDERHMRVNFDTTKRIIYKSFIIEGVINDELKIYANEQSWADCFRCIQRAAANLYIKKQ